MMGGQSGGLLTSWDNNDFTLLDHEIRSNWIWVRLAANENPSLVANFINIYAPHYQTYKKELWNQLQIKFDAYHNESFCFMGDLNCIRNETESQNCTYRSKDSEDLNDFILLNNLLDIPINNYTFSWFGPLNKQSQLDRALLSQNWKHLQQWNLKGIGRKHSDHVFLHLFTNEYRNWGPKPCKPFNAWLSESALPALINNILLQQKNSTSPLMKKMRKVRCAIQ